jgi:hypothetical protein
MDGFWLPSACWYTSGATEERNLEQWCEAMQAILSARRHAPRQTPGFWSRPARVSALVRGTRGVIEASPDDHTVHKVFFLTTGDADGFRRAISYNSLQAVLPDCVQFMVADAYQRVAHIHAIFLMCWPCTTWGIQCRLRSVLASGDCKVTALQKNTDACLYYVLKQLAPGDQAVYYLRTGDMPHIAGLMALPSPGNDIIPSLRGPS